MATLARNSPPPGVTIPVVSVRLVSWRRPKGGKGKWAPADQVLIDKRGALYEAGWQFLPLQERSALRGSDDDRSCNGIRSEFVTHSEGYEVGTRGLESVGGVLGCTCGPVSKRPHPSGCAESRTARKDRPQATAGTAETW